MSKLFKLKEWLTLNEAINHISLALSEPVTEADIYRLALDKHLTLSVNFVNGACAFLGRRVGLEYLESITGKLLESTENLNSKGKYPWDGLLLPKLDTTKVMSIRGVWDLTLIGSEAIDLEFYYQQLTSGLEVTLAGFEGVFVEQDGVIAQLLTDFEDNEFQKGSKAYCEKIENEIDLKNTSAEEIKNIRQAYNKERNKYLDSRKANTRESLYFPSGGLDEHEYVFVVRTSEINQFLTAINDNEYLNTVTPATSSQFNLSDQITQTETWQELYKLAEKGIEEFPGWQKHQRKPQKIPMDQIDRWLAETINATKREAETIKKIIIEIFKL
ncbi:hypothetical protein H4J58_15460 [Colwellia sp. MB3u-70]|uniref:hypothetical protein n=1 Tax=unclassified Colwellia TaxID=196834 RepID=UPI0015F4953F|nr:MULTISPECIES: hypothetical protein [unclassified Colwellia]MBA6291865.1 hypothetical protein [Colwellia sp. MB3u-8]MBA6308509.1 hypothetical protein [Colwellia sp. MB3u-70]